jgi:hypothetical protein
MQGDFALIKKDYGDVIGDLFWEHGKGLHEESS